MQKSCFGEYIRYMVLNVLGMLGLSCYILADTFFVSKGLGAEGLAALNLAIPVYNFIHGSGLMLGVGGATRYSVYQGQKEQKKANGIFSNTIYAAVIMILIFVMAGIFGAGGLTRLLGADERIFAMTVTYIRVILLFAPAFILNDILICFVRNDGNPQLSMAAMLIGSFANIILDYIFIFPLQMGIFGAVLATGFAPCISICILTRHWKREHHFRLARTKPVAAVIGKTISLGVSSFVGEVASGVVIIVFNLLILGLRGNVGVAAYGVVANISLVTIAIFTGIAQGMQPLVSRAHGKNETEKEVQFFRYAMCTVLLSAVFIYVGIFFGADAIAGIFNSGKNQQLQQMAVEGLRIYFLAMPFAGVNIVMAMFFSSTERALPAQTLALLRGLILIIPMAFLLAAWWGLSGVWISFGVTELAVVFVGIWLKRKAYAKKNE